MPTSAGPTSTPLRHRCIVWHPPSTSVDDDLVAALMSRRLNVTTASNAFDALAMVCASARLAPAPEPSAPSAATILVLSDPDALSAVVHVLSLVHRYAPRTACWVFEARGSRRLRPMERADAERWQTRHGMAGTLPIDVAMDLKPTGTNGRHAHARGAPASGGTPGAHAGRGRADLDGDTPRLRLAGEGPIARVEDAMLSSARTNPREVGQSGGPRQQLSDEELRMLLARDPDHGQN